VTWLLNCVTELNNVQATILNVLVFVCLFDSKVGGANFCDFEQTSFLDGPKIKENLFDFHSGENG